MNRLQIDFLRHGEPEGGRRYRGHGVDDPLSNLGWQQMWAAVGQKRPWDVVISSPMQRCLSFAQALAAQQALSVVVEPDFREVGFGLWEGKNAQEIRQNDHDALVNFYRDPIAHRPPNAEPLDHFRQRVGRALQQLMDSPAGQHILVVAHAGVMRAVISWMLNAPLSHLYRVDIANAAWLKLTTHPERPPMIRLHGPTLD
jgi:alpha-ribazole phosphatase